VSGASRANGFGFFGGIGVYREFSATVTLITLHERVGI